MKCNETRKRISAYVDNELDQAQLKKIEDHLNQCPVCLKEVALFRETDTCLKGILREDLSEEFHQKLVREVDAISISVDDAACKIRSGRAADRMMDRLSTLFRRRRGPWTMSAFDDFPPWTLGHVYLKLINQNR